MIITDEKQLQLPCQETSLFEAEEIVKKLEAELNASVIKGIGLAANQIGILKKVFILRVGRYSLNFANPVITDMYDLMEYENEGCLSFPQKYILTKRYAEICVKDIFYKNGLVLTGLMAVVFQHEFGHLNGETMYDHQIIRPEVNEKCWCNSGIKYKKCH